MSAINPINEGPPILTSPIAELPIIDELATFMHNHQFHNLKDLLAYSAPDLLKMEGFGYRCLKSLYQVLEDNGCEGMLRQE